MSTRYAELAESIRTTFMANADLKRMTRKIEVGEIEEVHVADFLQKNFKDKELPAVQIDAETLPGSSNAQETVTEAVYDIPVVIVTIVKATDFGDARKMCRLIVGTIETICNAQRSSTNNFSSAARQPITLSVHSSVEMIRATDHHYAIGTTELVVRAIESFA